MGCMTEKDKLIRRVALYHPVTGLFETDILR